MLKKLYSIPIIRKHIFRISTTLVTFGFLYYFRNALEIPLIIQWLDTTAGIPKGIYFLVFIIIIYFFLISTKTVLSIIDLLTYIFQFYKNKGRYLTLLYPKIPALLYDFSLTFISLVGLQSAIHGNFIPPIYNGLFYIFVYGITRRFLHTKETVMFPKVELKQ